MRRDDELRSAGCHEDRHLSQKRELALGRERRFRLVEQQQSRADSVLQNGEKRLSMRPCMKRSTPIKRVRIAPEIRVRLPLVQERCEMRLELGTKKVRVRR